MGDAIAVAVPPATPTSQRDGNGRSEGMTIEGHRTCPHCRALVQSTICAICGKSAFEEVAENEAPPRLRWWQKLDPQQTRRQALFVTGGLLLVGAAVYLVTRTGPPPNPDALPAPVVTSTSTTSTTPGRAPTVEGESGSRGEAPTRIAPGVDREVDPGLSPWEEAPPINFVTGRFFDVEIDFAADIARVDEVLAAFPGPFDLEPLETPEIMTFGGPVDIAATEASQPFAARIVSTGPGTLGQLWVVASGGTDAGDTYLAAARSRWDPARAVGQYAPEPGVRMWKLGENDEIRIWVTDLDDAAIVIFQTPLAIDPETLRALVVAWRTNLR